MIAEILGVVATLILGGFGIMGLIVSNDIITERKRRYRDGTHDYYGNRIENEEDK